MEYVGIDSSKQVYGKKNLLYCQMGMLTILKKLRAYKKLRKQEFALKKILKRKIKELQETLKHLETILPETKHEKFKGVKFSTAPKKRKDLEAEIEKIKNKIAELQ